MALIYIIQKILHLRINVIISDIKILEKTVFLLLLLSSDTILLTEIGNPICASVINRLNVGIKSIYSPIISVPIILVVIIFINMPNTFVTSPPIKSINVLFINLLFIIYTP